MHTKLVPRLGFAAAWVVAGICVYYDRFIGFEPLFPSLKILLGVVFAGVGLLPLVCDTARMFAAVMQWYFIFFVLCNEAAYFFGWVATGYPFNFWAGALSVLLPVFLLTFRRKYFLVGYVVSFFLAFVVQVPIERWAIHCRTTALHILLHTVPCVGRSYERLLDGFELHLLHTTPESRGGVAKSQFPPHAVVFKTGTRVLGRF